MYLLDTDICIYIVKRRPPQVQEKFESLPLGSVSMSTITHGELLFGALKSQYSERSLSILEQLLKYIPALPVPEKVARAYAEIRADLSARGQVIGNNDLWIAAHARAEGLILVTNNVREFARVDGLQIENWAA